MAALITREEVALVLDEDISVDRFDALYRQALRVVRTGYDGDPEAATGRTADVIAGVLFSVAARILSNPRAARQLNGGPAAVTFGGSDQDIRAVYSLSDAERADLVDVSTAGGSSAAFTIRAQRS